MMNDTLSAQIGGIKNTLSFPSGETSLGRGGFPHVSLWEMHHARPALLTVFSTTQSEHFIAIMSVHIIMEMKVFPKFADH